MKHSLQCPLVRDLGLGLQFHLHVREHKRPVWEMLCIFEKLLGISDGWDVKNKETRPLWNPGFSVSCRKRGEVWGMLTQPLPPGVSPGVPVLWEPFHCMMRIEKGLKWSFTPRRGCCWCKHSCQGHTTVTIQNQDIFKKAQLYLLPLVLFSWQQVRKHPSASEYSLGRAVCLHLC